MFFLLGVKVLNLLENVTQQQLSALLGVSEGRVSQLVSAGVIPAGAPVGAQVAAYCENLRAAAAGRTEPTEIATERARLLAARAAREELRLTEERGALIRVDAVRAVMARAFVVTRDGILNVPPRLAPQLAAETDPATIQEVLATDLRATLTELASAPSKLPGGAPSSYSAGIDSTGFEASGGPA